MKRIGELITVRRGEWDVTEPGRAAVRSWDDIEGVEIHWTGAAGPASLTFEEKQRWALAIERFHEKTKGWSDLFYQGFVFADGQFWEGRYELAISTSSARTWLTIHVPGTHGLSLTAAQKDMIVEIVRLTGGQKLRGHQERSATACPGPSAMAFIEEYRKGDYLTAKDWEAIAALVAAEEAEEAARLEAERVAAEKAAAVAAAAA